MIPDLFKRDLQIFVDELDLDDAQRAVLEQLYEDYELDFENGTQGMINQFQSMLEDLQGGDQKRILQIVFDPLKDWHAAKRDLYHQFLENVQAVVLSEGQRPLWPSFERRFRRVKQLPKGEFAAEDIDLFVLLRKVDPDRKSFRYVEPVLAEYEVALDNLLRQREELALRAFAAMTKAIQQEDADLSLSVIDQQIAGRVLVRDTNIEYARRMVDALPAGMAGEFHHAFLIEAYPRIYRPTQAERMFAAAKELDDLAPEMLPAIENLEHALNAEIGVLNEQIELATRQVEPKRARQRAENFAAKMAGRSMQPMTESTREEFKEREEVGSTYVVLLQNILTEDQFAQLPRCEPLAAPRRSRGRRQAQGSASGGRIGRARAAGPKQTTASPAGRRQRCRRQRLIIAPAS